MKSITPRFVSYSVAFFVACGFAAVASAQTRTIRVVAYNLMDDVNQGTINFVSPLAGLITPFTGTQSGNSFTTNSTGSVTNGGVLEGIGEETIAGDPAQPIDILALEETTSNTATVLPIVNGLNIFYAAHNIAAGYAMSLVQATTDGGVTNGNGPNALVYNTNTVQLLASVGIVTPTGGVPNGNGAYRQPMRYEFAPAGVTAGTNNEFYVYVSHYKASTGVTNALDRWGEAMIIRNDEANNLPANARVLYVGDYNPDNNSSEAGYQTILSNSSPNGVKQGQGIDPLNLTASTTINWSSSTTSTQILFMLTDESYEVRYRDDLQLMTSNVYYDVAGGLQYVPGTYHAFGNNASLPYGASPVNTNNTALNGIPANALITRAQCYTNLTGASDHLPIVADYTIPIPAAAPVASFTGSPTNGVGPLTVTFTDTSTGSITNRSWTFGDGGTTNLTTNSVVYTYTTAGIYTVSEIVSGAGGSSTNTQVNYITVLTPFQAWQIQYFGSTTNPAAAATADPDGDGQNNLAEFLAGTNPTNSASGLQITSVTTQGNDVLVTWTTAGGYTNVVQAAASLSDGSYSTNFQDLSGWIIISGNGDAVTNYLDSGGATNIPARYYRIRVQP